VLCSPREYSFPPGSLFAALPAGAVVTIPTAAIDHNRARGADPDGAQQRTTELADARRVRLLVVFAVRHAVSFRQRAAAAAGGQKLAPANKELATAMMSSCIVAAQLVMLPISLFAGRKADQWGRKPILLVGFAILPCEPASHPVHPFGRQFLADRSSTTRWRGCWNLRRLDAACRRGPYTLHRPIVRRQII
jgi:MFS family permease